MLRPAISGRQGSFVATFAYGHYPCSQQKGRSHSAPPLVYNKYLKPYFAACNADQLAEARSLIGLEAAFMAPRNTSATLLNSEK